MVASGWLLLVQEGREEDFYANKRARQGGQRQEGKARQGRQKTQQDWGNYVKDIN
jgi:hypothetical protein